MASWIQISEGARRLNRGLRSSECALLAVILMLYAGDLFFVGGCRKDSPTEPPNQPPDTTSHSVSWQTFRFGQSLSGLIEDVSIVNDTLAYAVGDIYLKDSTGAVDPLCYNFFRWNGRTWSVERQAATVPLRAVYAYSDTDIWVAAGLPRHWNGSQWTVFQVAGGVNGNAFRFGGSGPTDLYMVGDYGTIAHYDGSIWQKVESGTTLPVKDVFGAFSPGSGTWQVLAVAADQYSSLARRILRLDGLTATLLPDQPLTLPITTVWFSPDVRYYVGGAGIYYKKELADSLWQGGQFDVTINYAEALRGTAANDIFAAGDFGELLHYSGKTWHSYRSEVGLVGGAFYGLAVKGGIVIAVGTDPPNGVIVVGRRIL